MRDKRRNNANDTESRVIRGSVATAFADKSVSRGEHREAHLARVRSRGTCVAENFANKGENLLTRGKVVVGEGGLKEEQFISRYDE